MVCRRIFCFGVTIALSFACNGAFAKESPDSSSGVVTPQAGEVVRPFNGKDLSGWTTWLEGIGTVDANSVYSVADGTLRISGEGMGYVATVSAYKNYHLSLEYRWGEKTDGSGYVRNSGVLLHANGPDGNAKGVWMASIECQLAQGCEGDMILINGINANKNKIPNFLASNTIVGEDGKTRWNREGKATPYTGKQFWWSKHQAGFSELLDARGKEDVASPLDEWTRVDCVCNESEITININGETVNHGFDSTQTSGNILLENEGNEIYFRNIEIRPLQ